ncbi:MAG: TonB-dependent receptor [Bacteroidales bacterium]|nr:TonB-dependent receptor [Bacteroidales bacterium]
MKKTSKVIDFKQFARKVWSVSLLILFLGYYCGDLMAQGSKVSGKLTDSSGNPVPGATIVVKGTTNGTLTGVDGNYSLNNVNPSATLIFSFVGMTTQEIALNGRTQLDVTLVSEAVGLEEVVVVGYGTMRKKDLTGSVASVDRAQILSNPSVSAISSIQGKVAGIDVFSTSQKPGDAPTIRVRGNRSIKASNDPLYVVDGIPFMGDLKDVNSADIESIEVLKDASATAIYGSRGANGVVLVTTRRGKSGKSEVTFDSYYGVQVNNKLDIMNAEEFVECRRQAQRNAGKYASDVPTLALDKTMFYYPDKYVLESISAAYDENGNYDPSKIKSYDWVGAISQTGTIQDHQLNVLGGTDKTKISFSAGYFDNKGGIQGYGYSKYSLRLTIDQEINRWLKIGGSMASSFNKKEETTNVFYYAAITNPLNPFRDENGVLQLMPGGELMANAILAAQNDATENKANRFYGSYYAEIKLPAGIKYRLNFGPDYQDGRTGVFRGSKGSLLGGSPTASNSTFNQFHYTLDNLLYYDKIFNNVHRLGVTLLNSIESYNYESLNGSVSGLPYEYQMWNNLGTATAITGLGSSYSQWRLNSYMGRVNYALKDKYMLTLTGRYDGSSRLAEDHKYSFFPSVAFSWRIIDEPFMKSISLFDDLKLRMGYGKTGNTSISPYETLGSLSRTTYVSGDNGFFGYAPNLLINSDLRWETTGQYDMGLDFSLLNKRLSGSIDVYQQNTHDLLLPRQLPIASGFSSITQNIGSTRNSGIEVSLSGLLINTAGGFQWRTDVMFYANKEEITELYYGKVDDIGNKWFIGHPINSYYDYKFTGIWQNTDEDNALMAQYNANGSTYAPGEIKLYDKDDNKKITADDRVILGSTVPKWSGSLSSTMEYKGIDFSFFLYTRQGQTVYDEMGGQYEARYNWLNVNYWTPENKSNEFPRPLAGRQTPLNFGTVCYQDGSFVKLKYVTLGYTIPERILSKIDMHKLRIYATAQNPYMHKNCWSIDPEGLGFNVPSVKTFIVGLSASF